MNNISLENISNFLLKKKLESDRLILEDEYESLQNDFDKYPDTIFPYIILPLKNACGAKIKQIEKQLKELK